MKNCTQCPHVLIVNDRDPNDWFCDDDTAVLCSLTPWEKGDLGPNAGGTWAYKPVTVSCRPYQIEKETLVPVWCPLKKKDKK